MRVGKQMDEGWIFEGKRLKDAVGEEQADLIREAYEAGDVGSQLVNIKKDGNVVLRYLDKNANLIRK